MVSLTFVAFGQVMNQARQRAEELAQGLRVTKERLTLAQQASQIGSFDWNLETGVNTWSPELYDMYGIRPEEFGHTQGAWERYLHPDDRDEMVRAVEQSRTSGSRRRPRVPHHQAERRDSLVGGPLAVDKRSLGATDTADRREYRYHRAETRRTTYYMKAKPGRGQYLNRRSMP